MSDVYIHRIDRKHVAFNERMLKDHKLFHKRALLLIFTKDHDRTERAKSSVLCAYRTHTLRVARNSLELYLIQIKKNSLGLWYIYYTYCIFINHQSEYTRVAFTMTRSWLMYHVQTISASMELFNNTSNVFWRSTIIWPWSCTYLDKGQTVVSDRAGVPAGGTWQFPYTRQIRLARSIHFTTLHPFAELQAFTLPQAITTLNFTTCVSLSSCITAVLQQYNNILEYILCIVGEMVKLGNFWLHST